MPRITAFDRLALITQALSAGSNCSTALSDQVIAATGYTPQELSAMTVAQLLAQAASWLVLRTENIDLLLSPVTGPNTAAKLQLLFNILATLRNYPGTSVAERFSLLHANYPRLQSRALEKLEELTLYYEVSIPSRLRNIELETKLKHWNALLAAIKADGTSISTSQIIDAYESLFTAQRAPKNSKYKPAEVLRLLGAPLPQGLTAKDLRRACSALLDVKPLPFLQYLFSDTETDAYFLTGVAFPLLKQQLFERHNIDHLLVIAPNSWFISACLGDSRLRGINTTYVVPDSCSLQSRLIQLACSESPNAKVISDSTFYRASTTFPANTAVILFTAAGYPVSNKRTIRSIQQKCGALTIPLFIITGNAEYSASAPIFSALKSEYITAQSIVLFPQDLPDPSYPRRKQLICASVSGIPIPQPSKLELIRLVKVLQNDLYLLTAPRPFESVVWLDYAFFLANQSETLQTVYTRIRRNGATRNSADTLQLSPELTISYRFQTRSQSHGPARQLEASFLTPTCSSAGSTKAIKMRKLSATTKRKTVPVDFDYTRWLNRTYPFLPADSHRVIDLLRDECEDLLRKSDKGISYKTAAYFYYDPLAAGKDPDATNRIGDLMDTELGQLNVRTPQEEIDTILSNLFESGAQRTRALNTLIEISKLAVQNGYLSESPLRPYFKSSKNVEFSEIRNSLADKSFSAAEMDKVLKATLTAIATRSSMCLSTLIRIFTGLEPQIVAALHWSDYIHNDTFDFCQLRIERQIDTKTGEEVGFDFEKSYRTIPVSPILQSALDQEHPHHADDDYIIAHPDGSRLSPSEIKDLDRQIYLSTGQKDKKIHVPDANGEIKEIDLASYSGDFFRTNADFWFGQIGLTEDELKYLLGLYPLTTSGRKYCDFAAPETQYLMYRKLCRWMPVKVAASAAQESHHRLQANLPLSLPGKVHSVTSVTCTLSLQTAPDSQLNIACTGGATASISALEVIP